AIPELKALYDKNPDAKKVIDVAKKLEGVARHASVHACGVVISAEPLTNYMALQKAPQGDDSIITQCEMHAVEDLGVLKMDFLGLKNLTIIEKTLRIIRELHGVVIDIDALPLDDQKTFELLRAGDTTGVFQLESSGMRHYLKELVPTELEDIIAMISLYRPGPMELIPSYILRKHGKEEVAYIHPRLEPILKNTYGVGVYQEQMMRIARDLAGFTLAEADTLRKAIGKKIKELLAEQKMKLINGMVKNGISEKTAKEIWELFPPFARYGFNRSHAACYATISYQTAYLKAHYPVEFTTSLLNVSGADIDRIDFLVSEARHLNIKVLPPDINLSAEDFAVDGPNIRFGLSAIKNVGTNIVQYIIEERNNNGPYADFTNFINRMHHKDLNKKSLESLAMAGAFDSLGITRGDILANIEDIILFNQTAKRNKATNQNSLFGADQSVSKLRIKPAPPVDKGTILKWEKELLGIYVTGHPFQPFIPLLRGKIKPIKEVLTMPPTKYERNGGSKEWVAGAVSVIEKIVTKKGTPMLFVTIEDGVEKIELLVFEEAIKKTPLAWEVGKCIAASGRVSFKNDEQKFICDEARILVEPKK
ncbi:MAG: DNA polymerase III subunit alpha, partial [Patescibacteria group bacterium]